ncbi:MAG: serine/threonine-protein kinase [Myxococcota bacterium]
MNPLVGGYERATGDRNDVKDDIEEAATLLANEDRVSPAEDSPHQDSMSVGTGVGKQMAALLAPAPRSDQLFAVERARVFEAMFEVPAEPQQLGRYVVLGTLGKGGMGTVLEAFDRTLDRKVAVKVLHQELDKKHAARLLREAQAMAKLSHPNVVQVYDADTLGGQTFVAMELVQGQTLKAWMKQDPSPDWRQCVKVFIQVGQGLAAAHAEGLIHRDFKPGNAIVDDKGRARVLDFGLARWTEVRPTEEEGLARARAQTQGDTLADTSVPQSATTHTMAGRVMKSRTIGTRQARGTDEPTLDQASNQALTKTGTVLGTPAYMPPEQMKGQEADTRSDQFSFCIALWEAIYGLRPFEGGNMVGLMISMVRGEVRPAPKGSRVPARLRTVLLRGLAVDPTKRWPSMEALLTQLRTLVAPNTRRWMALGVTVGLAALGGGLAMPQVLKMQDRCTGAPAQMDGIWDDERRGQVQAAILGTELSFAPGTWERIEPQLDEYAQTWIDTHTEACKASSMRSEQTPEEMSLRMRCLDRRRTALRASVDQLVDADLKRVTNAVELVAGLPPLTRCDDLLWLEQQNQRVPPPEDTDVVAAVQAQRNHLAEIKAMRKAGRYADALGEVERVVQHANALGYPPLQAEGLYWRGVLRQDNGQYAEAERDLRKAYTLAVKYHHDSVALDTAQSLTFLMGYHLAQHAEGQHWGEIEALPLAQRSGEPLEEAASLNSLSAVFLRQGDYENARVYRQRALAIRQKALGPDHLDVALSLSNLGNVLKSQGDYENARAHHQRALAIKEKALGPDHPHVATSLSNLGIVFESQGDYDKAWDHHQRALAIKEKVLDSNHPDIAISLNNLGNVFLSRGELDKARAHHQRALAIREKALGPHHPRVATSLIGLGNVYSRQRHYEKARVHHERALAIREKVLGPDHPGVAMSLHNLGCMYSNRGELEKARALYERALAIREKALGPDHPRVAASLNNLGNVLFRQGELDKARDHHLRALRIKEKALGPDHPLVADLLMGIATNALDTGDLASARAHAERAVSIREGTTVDLALLAGARFVLARALWSTRSERAHARALAEQAQDALAAAESPGKSDVDLAEVTAWLATHRVK